MTEMNDFSQNEMLGSEKIAVNSVRELRRLKIGQVDQTRCFPLAN
jgi:hypothetical protein